MKKEVIFRTDPYRDRIMAGDLVCYKCNNPAVGRVTRAALNCEWVEVKWFDKAQRAKRYPRENILLLNALINQFLEIGKAAE